MSDASRWSFSFTDKGFLRVRREPALAAELENPVVMTLSDAGHWPKDVRRYRASWLRYVESGDPVPLCGNAICLFITGDQVVINSFFDDWPDVSMPRDEFDGMLGAYYEFLVGLVGGENVDPEEPD